MKKLIILLSLIGTWALAETYGSSTINGGMNGIIKFLQDGVETSVSEDTVTPANSDPLPVKLFGGAFAGAVDQGAPNTTANAWPIRVTDGTNDAIVTATGALGINIAELSGSAPSATNYLPNRLTDGVGFYDARQIRALTAADIVSIEGGNTLPVVVDGSGFTQPISAVSLPLPTGAATEATLAAILVDTGAISVSVDNIDTSTASMDATLTAINGKLPATLGQTTMANSFAVTLASDQSPLDVSVVSSVLPTGAATEATLAAILADTANIDTSTAATAVSTASIDSKLNTLGQKTMATSAPVVIASDQSSIPVTIAGNQNVNLAQVAGTATSVNNGTADAGTQRVVIASDNTAFTVNAAQSGTWNINNISGTISLPTGAATSANQTTANTSLGNIDTSTAAINGKLNNNYGVDTGALRTAAQVGNAAGVADFNYGAVGAQTLRSAAQIGNSTGAADFGSGATTAQTLRVRLTTDSTVSAVVGGNTTGTFATGSISAVTTLTAPAGATGFIIQAEDTNTANLRFSSGTAASSTSGIQLQPGRSETFDLGANVSICPESGTQKYSIQWKSP